MHWTALSPKNVETTDRIGHFLSFNITPTSFFVKSIKINIAQNKKAGLERSQGATCGLPAQVRQKHLHCMGKAYNAGKSPVLKVFKGGLRLLPATFFL